MRRGSGSLAVGVVTLAIGVCGLMVLSGFAPPPAARQLAGDVLPSVTPLAGDPVAEDPPPTTDPDPTSTTTTTTTTTTTPAPALAPGLLPLTASASSTIVGIGGAVTFEGTCPTTVGVLLGPLVVRVISSSTETITTGISATDWSYTWTAPDAEPDVASFSFQFWCGEPDATGYPLALQLTVDIVAQAGPATPSTTVPPTDTPPDVVIPETG